jgi:hypothetical protein
MYNTATLLQKPVFYNAVYGTVDVDIENFAKLINITFGQSAEF